MERCRIIVRYGIGVETIAIAAATKHNIMVANVPDYCIEEVSDHALTLLLMLSRQVVPAMSLAKEEHWSVAKMPQLHRLRGQTCGLFGLGKIGSLLASKVAQLGMHILVCDPYLGATRTSELGVERVAFDVLLERSDFLSIHAPLSDETRHVFGKNAFRKMKNTSYLINTARGGLIDEVALLVALDSGTIAGAALDVMDSETLKSTRASLMGHPKIIVTPHSAWLSQEARSSLQAHAIAQVIACLKGEVPYGLINRTVNPRGWRFQK
jgi:D-3-phosphoglycerate dehydrogenase